MRSILTRALFALALLSVAGLSWPQLAEQLRWRGYAGFATEVAEGRFEPGDLDLLAPAIARAGPDLHAAPRLQRCNALRRTPLLTLNLYATDLIAAQAGDTPPAEDPVLAAQLQAGRALVEAGLACRPMDGDLWLTLALFSSVMGDPPEQTARFLALSTHHAPHEGWIATRRAQFF